MRTESWPELLSVSHPHPRPSPPCGPGTWRTAPSGTRRTRSPAHRMASPRQIYSGPQAPVRGRSGPLTYTPGEGTRPLRVVYAQTHTHTNTIPFLGKTYLFHTFYPKRTPKHTLSCTHNWSHTLRLYFHQWMSCTYSNYFSDISMTDLQKKKKTPVNGWIYTKGLDA